MSDDRNRVFNRAFVKFATEPFDSIHYHRADPEHLTECQVCRDLYGEFPDNPYRLTSRWRLLPHFAQAYEEAQQIVYVLGRSSKYGWSRTVNTRGVRYTGKPRFLDKFKDKKARGSVGDEDDFDG